MKYKNLFFVFCSIFFVLSLVSALDNVVLKNDSEFAISQSEKIIQEMNESGFKTTRVSDILLTAKNLQEAQNLMSVQRRNPNYAIVLTYTNQIEEVKDLAYESKDVLFSLNKEYNSLRVKSLENNIPINETAQLVFEINDNFENERYEEVLQMTDIVEKSILDADAEITTFNIFYSSLSRGLLHFLRTNAFGIFFFCLAIIVFLLIYKFYLYEYVLMARLDRLRAEQEVIRSLIAKSQKDYFEKGKLSEATYHARIEKYSEMIRDLERQIPLINEELARAKGLDWIKSQRRKQNETS